MRLLHIGSGFRPWRRGGLVAYVEDLMAEQVRAGHDVAYLFSGRAYPFVSGPRLRRFDRDGIAMREVVNSPLYDHGRQPALEVAEPRIERMVERAVSEHEPDVVHVHEVAGLPSSVLDVPRTLGVPVVVTLQDYFLLCPVFKLLDHSGQVCLRREVGADCVATTAADPREPWLMVEATLRHDLPRLPLVRRVPPHRRDPAVARISTALARRAAQPPDGASRSALAFQRRRDVNVARLSAADRVIAMSQRVADLHTELGVDPARIETMTLTLAHIERLRPRARRPDGPLTFATLGALESTAKGGRLLLDAIRAVPAPFRLLVFGHAAPDLAAEAAALPQVELRGPYAPEQLDALLDEVDVGLMPSVWEEAYGYAGVEFLAKGIPVIGNAIGGIVEYVRPGRTGWLNRSCSAGELASLMRTAIERPHEVDGLRAQVIAARDELVIPMADHARAMEAVYAKIAR